MSKSKSITVLNLGTKVERVYHGVSPEEAVICAYAQERGDYNTWDYGTKYGSRVRQINGHIYCGLWTALEPEVVA